MRRAFLTLLLTPVSLLTLAFGFMPRRILQAQVTDHTNAFTGTWKLNPSRSKYASGQGPKSATITFAPDGSLTFQVVQIDGKRFKWSHEWSVRKEVPVNGIENGTIITKLQGNVVDDTMRISGQVVQIIQAVLSSDGIELTATITHLDEQRHALQDVQVFERQ